MKQLRTIELISLVVLILIPIISATPQLPISHKPVYCFYNCHGEQGFDYGLETDDWCGTCHLIYPYNPNFSVEHEPKTCPACHGVETKDDFHSLHTNKTSCFTCHINNALPEGNYLECLTCHVSGLHSTHIEKSCDICHVDRTKIAPLTKSDFIEECDEWGENCNIIYLNNTINSTISINTSKPIVNYQKMTIYEILLNIYEAIRDDIIWQK